MIWTDSEGNTFGGSDKKLLTTDEIQKMKSTASDMIAWGKTLKEIKASRGGQTPQDMHKIIVREKVLDDVKWGEDE